jgi:hydroxymethylpyrimidine pyrophosphatase-like HAD family hydrolase
LIRLFLSDIDGCLAAPYEPYDLDGFRTLADYARRAEADERLPRLGLCSGRAYAYVEAVAQALGLRGPALFESGGGRFDLPAARIRWSPHLTPEVEQALAGIRDYFHDEVLPGTRFSYDYGKRAQSGVVGTDAEAVERMAQELDHVVSASYPALAVHATPVSVDVVPRVLSKRAGIETVAEQEGLRMEEIAFIGDTGGDIEALEAVGFSFAPQNAAPEVKAVVGVVTGGAVMDGVLEAYRWCVRHNEAELASV